MPYSINQALLVGNVARDPELKFTQGGTAVCNFAVATSRGVKKNEQWENIATFHNIVVWGKLAEQLGKSLHKGMKVTVLGRIDNRSWEKDGVKKYRTEIVADSVIYDQRKDQDEHLEEPPTDAETSNVEDVSGDVPF